MSGAILKDKSPEARLHRHHARLLPYAYNILGDTMEAEDVVQEVLNNYLLTDHSHVQNPDHYLVKSVVNRAINEKKRQHTRREQYPGLWLPAPLCTEESIYGRADRDRILHYALLVLLERLNPRERAVFILKETFDFSHVEIAGILEIEADHSRQLLKRARQKLKPHPGVSPTVRNEDRAILQQLTDAILEADVQRVEQLLSEEVHSLSDGGHKARAARKVISGKEHIYKLLLAVYGKFYPDGSSTAYIEVNHSPAIVYKKQGAVYRCIVFEMHGKEIGAIYIIVNPDKLQQLNFSL